jgi:hypothetical protein
MLRHVFAKSVAAISRQTCGPSANPLLACRAVANAEGTLLGVLKSDVAGSHGLLMGNHNQGLVTRTLATSSCSQLVRPGSGDAWAGMGMHAFGTSTVCGHGSVEEAVRRMLTE